MTDAAIDAIRRLKSAGYSIEEIGLRTGSSRAQISNIWRRCYPAKADLEQRLIRAARALPKSAPLVSVDDLADR